MVNPNNIYNQLINLLETNNVEYKLFEHKPALTYEDLLKVQKEYGFVGAEAKCMVLKADSKFIVYITIQGNKINFDTIKKVLNLKKISLANLEDLRKHFGAEPGCAYPFGFSSEYDIYIDPIIYQQEWLLFSPVFSTKTVQARGLDLKKVFNSLENQVYEITNFNQ